MNIKEEEIEQEKKKKSIDNDQEPEEKQHEQENDDKDKDILVNQGSSTILEKPTVPHQEEPLSSNHKLTPEKTTTDQIEDHEKPISDHQDLSPTTDRLSKSLSSTTIEDKDEAVRPPDIPPPQDSSSSTSESKPSTRTEQLPTQSTPPISSSYPIHQDQQYTSPLIQQLANMFPQIQPSILEAVLIAHRNDVSACIPDLLAMSDPTYKPSEQDIMVKADEELARQLDMQENHHQDPSYSPSNQAQQDQAQVLNVPYQPRIKRNSTLNRNTRLGAHRQASEAEDNQSVGMNGKDEIQKIAEELGKLAETGKKTMSLWLNKAKAKMQEMQQPTPSSGNGSPDSIESGYEKISRPSSSSSNFNGTSPTSTQHTRITPNLPYGSRYQTGNTSSKDARATQQPSGSSRVAEGYDVDESSQNHLNADKKREVGMVDEKNPSALRGVVPALGQSTSSKTSAVGVVSHQKVREDDEESLEYTRNPFEDDD